uniref:Uncharacterized protein n=1 Tax=Rhizophora mucronata TaxID=61149 RepID=A0A2P2Q9C6_RHIMU
MIMCLFVSGDAAMDRAKTDLMTNKFPTPKKADHLQIIKRSNIHN